MSDSLLSWSYWRWPERPLPSFKNFLVVGLPPSLYLLYIQYWTEFFPTSLYQSYLVVFWESPQVSLVIYKPLWKYYSAHKFFSNNNILQDFTIKSLKDIISTTAHWILVILGLFKKQFKTLFIGALNSIQAPTVRKYIIFSNSIYLAFY